MRKHLVESMTLSLLFGALIGFGSISFAQEMAPPLQYNSPAEYQSTTGKEITEFNEAPVLAELVKAGKLPPVVERLPQEPLVVTPVEEVGQYGGTLRSTWYGPGSSAGTIQLLLYESFVLKDPYRGGQIIPNIAEEWTLSEDGRVMTVFLRKGIKWSDGVPFTADDVMFWWEDFVLNDELMPVKPLWVSKWGGKVEKVDTYTIKVVFPEPRPVVAYRLLWYDAIQGEITQGLGYMPKHYMKQFHPKYTPVEKLEETMKKEGFDTWYSLFSTKASTWDRTLNPELPVLEAWVLKETSPTRVTFERNPYYWKVDTDGNQLPYIDRIVFTTLQNPEVAVLKVASGEIDLVAELPISNYTFFMEGREQGDYRVYLWESAISNQVGLFINQTYSEDEVLWDLFREKEFRIALSLAINRNEINQIVYQGLGIPLQVSVSPSSPYYVKEFGESYIQYDPDEANRLLDELGLTKRDKEGYRLRPDGKRLEILIEAITVAEAQQDPILFELIKEYWKNVGIKLDIKPISSTLHSERKGANLLQVVTQHVDRAVDPFITTNGIETFFLPLRVGGPLPMPWIQWYESEGKQGETPPDYILEGINLYNEAIRTIDESQRNDLVKEILRIQADNLMGIGTVGLVPVQLIVKNDLHNIPEKGIWGWEFRGYTCYHPCQFFFK